jgi:GT2 family glycosyltransferase
VTTTRSTSRQSLALDHVGVFVLGMHRSGTSAVTRIINLLGVPICREADLVPAAPSNPRGHWESASMVRVNDELLRRLGRAWWCPPRLGQAWHQDSSAEAEIFTSIHPTTQWVCKDPRLCLTLPFWLQALRVRVIAILVIRSPMEIARSLKQRNGFYTELSIALWERYVHHALAGLGGIPTSVVRFDDLLNEPMETAVRLQAFLAEHGVASFVPAAGVIRDFVDPALNHEAVGPRLTESERWLSGHQRELASIIGSLPSGTVPVPSLSLPVETPQTDQLFTHLQSQYGLARPATPKRLSRAEVSVIVPTRSEGQALRRTINLLTQTLPERAEILVVDDNSTDGSTMYLHGNRRVRVLTAPEPLGVAGARNLGAGAAQGDVLVFSDAHVAPHAGWLAALLQALDRPEVAAAGPTLSDLQTGTVKVHSLEFVDAALNVRWTCTTGAEPVPVPLLCGCFMAVRRDAFERAGAFDGCFNSYGAEDLEFSVRLWRLGYECVTVSAAEVRHRWKRHDLGSLDWQSFVANLIRLAHLHLSPENLAEFMGCLTGSQAFPQAYAHALAGDMLRRREELSSLCPYDDRWFLSRFGMNIFAGEGR